MGHWIAEMYKCIIGVKQYRAWENFGGGKFWRINASKAFGEEKFGESASSQSKNPTCEPVSNVSVSSTC